MAYGIIADVHAHTWSQFSKIEPDGVNSRLRIILNELHRTCSEVMKTGSDTVIIAGDLFHVRGVMDPEVFNPVHDTFSKLTREGMRFLAIPGNHDLKGRETTELGNAMQSLGALSGFDVLTEPITQVVDGEEMAFIPWQGTHDGMRAAVNGFTARAWREMKLFCHIGVNEVFPTMPANGFNLAEVQGWGFQHIYTGHYHRHLVMPGVTSIGATTHHSFVDIGTRAGFMVGDRHFPSQAPQFTEIDLSTDLDDYVEVADGNYVRVKDLKLTDTEIVELRTELVRMGALGVVFDVVRKTVSARTSAPVSGMTLGASVNSYIDELAKTEELPVADIKSACGDILTRAQTGDSW